MEKQAGAVGFGAEGVGRENKVLGQFHGEAILVAAGGPTQSVIGPPATSFCSPPVLGYDPSTVAILAL
jgi:hypothetical protein